MKYEIWMEGFNIQGQRAVAHRIDANVEADSFAEACHKSFSFNPDYNKENLTVWGCRLFDNETDARKSFG